MHQASRKKNLEEKSCVFLSRFSFDGKTETEKGGSDWKVSCRRFEYVITNPATWNFAIRSGNIAKIIAMKVDWWCAVEVMCHKHGTDLRSTHAETFDEENYLKV